MKEHMLTSIRMNGNEPRIRVPSASALGQADRLASVGQLAGGLAHEMNTPLGSISAHAEESLEVLNSLDGQPLSKDSLDELRGRLIAIIRQANRCNRIATRLLQFAQPARPVGETSRPTEIIAAVIELFAPAAHEKGVHLDQRIEPDLPATPISPSDMEQLLMNLVQNSLDACTHGATILIHATVREEQFVTVVTDTGCGIRHELLNRIFDPFFTTKPVGQGTGLGLSVCHGIVRRAGGSIEVASAPGEGTRVTVNVPIHKGPVAGTLPSSQRSVVSSQRTATFGSDEANTALFGSHSSSGS